jgi:hypothetical protein
VVVVAVNWCLAGIHEMTPENTGTFTHKTGRVQVYCRDCRRAKRTPAVCPAPGCGKEFMATRNRIYCSKACANRKVDTGYIPGQGWVRDCLGCGVEFVTQSRGLRYHTEECKRLARNSRHSGRVQARRLPVGPLVRYAQRVDVPLDLTGDAEGKISFYEVDELAIKRLGIHPALIYGDEWWEAAAA